MNERIRELIAEADRKCSETHGIYDEILAELIVKECANYITKYYDSRDEAYYMKKHFGVEE